MENSRLMENAPYVQVTFWSTSSTRKSEIRSLLTDRAYCCATFSSRLRYLGNSPEMTYCPTHPLHSSSYVKLLLFVIPVCLAHAPLVRGDITAHIPAQQRVGALDVMWTRCGGAQAGDPVERRLKTPPEDPFQVVRIQNAFSCVQNICSGSCCIPCHQSPFLRRHVHVSW